MNTSAAESFEITSATRGARGRELIAWSIALAVLHAPLLIGGNTSALALLPARVIAGEWWRLFTHPFVHVSFYHFILDGAAFLLLWHSLRGSLLSRLGTLAASVAGGLIFASLGSSAFWTAGLCGLSGVAHGLMTRQAADLWRDARSSTDRRLAGILLGGVLGKCLIEAFTGSPFFRDWHLGPLGTPIVICHLGGTCGALFFMALEGTVRVPQPARP